MNYINQALPSQTAKQVRNSTPNHKYVNKARKSTLFLLQILALTLFVMKNDNRFFKPFFVAVRHGTLFLLLLASVKKTWTSGTPRCTGGQSLFGRSILKYTGGSRFVRFYLVRSPVQYEFHDIVRFLPFFLKKQPF